MIATALSNILKLFLPSWNFFNDFSAVPRLDARIIQGGRESEWRPLHLATPTRSIRRVFFNADGNLELLEKTFIERAAEEFTSDHPRTRGQQSVTESGLGKHHETLSRIVRSRLKATQSADEFQFRLVMTSAGVTDEVLFVSARHQVEEESR
jgi:hypothetical protein